MLDPKAANTKGCMWFCLLCSTDFVCQHQLFGDSGNHLSTNVGIPGNDNFLLCDIIYASIVIGMYC